MRNHSEVNDGTFWRVMLVQIMYGVSWIVSCEFIKRFTWCIATGILLVMGATKIIIARHTAIKK